MKLIVFENPEQTGTLNHLGVERQCMEKVEAAGLTLQAEGDVVCCYARQDKHWVTGPDGQKRENYVVLADAHAELEGRTSLADVDLRLRDDSIPVNGGCAPAAARTRPPSRPSARAGSDDGLGRQLQLTPATPSPAARANGQPRPIGGPG